MKLEEYQSWDDERLRDTINTAFELAMENQGDDRRVLLVEAEFYVNELERRENRRNEVRREKAEAERDRIEAERWRIDLRYERWIVGLIILEVIVAALMTWWADNRQSKSSAKELAALQGVQQVLSNLQGSSDATARTLENLQKTTEQMNKSIQTEVGLNYDVAVEVTFDNQVKHVNISNKGRTNVYVWGDRLDLQKPLFEMKGRMIAPGGYYYILADTFYEELGGKMPKGSQRLVPFEVFLKNENGDQFIVECQFFAVWYLDLLTIHTQTTSVRRAKWDGKEK